MIQLKSVFNTTILALALVLSGCSRTVTSKDVILNLQIILTLDGPVDLSRFNYYLIFSKSAGITLPPNGSPFLYFPTPGRTFNQDYLLANYQGLATYYSTYYTTWSDYIILTKDRVSLYQSGSTQFSAPTTTQNGQSVVATENFFFPPSSGFSPVISINGNTIAITFQAQQIAGASSLIYVDAATAELNVNANLVGFDAGEFRDRLTSPIGVVIEQNNDVSIPQSDSNEPSIKQGADILSCRIRIL